MKTLLKPVKVFWSWCQWSQMSSFWWLAETMWMTMSGVRSLQVGRGFWWAAFLPIVDFLIAGVSLVCMAAADKREELESRAILYPMREPTSGNTWISSYHSTVGTLSNRPYEVKADFFPQDPPQA